MRIRLKDDQLGNIKLTKDGLRQWDRLVLRAVRAAGHPTAIITAGGYARQLLDTVDINVATIEEARTELGCETPKRFLSLLKQLHRLDYRALQRSSTVSVAIVLGATRGRTTGPRSASDPTRSSCRACRRPERAGGLRPR